MTDSNPPLWDIGGRQLRSRLLLGTARYPSLAVLQQAIAASGAEIVTVSLRRESATERAGNRFWSTIKAMGVQVLPNTAGCKTVKEAVTTAEMGREIFETSWLKLEVIGDDYTLQPHPFLLVEAAEEGETKPGRFEVLDTRSWTQFSNAIRTNFGFLSRAAQDDVSVVHMEGNMIKQVGNKVFKEVTVAGHKFIVGFLADHGLEPRDIRRFWLHQANSRMNAMILRLSFGEEVGQDRAPTVLDRLGNTAAAGAIIALCENHEDMKAGDYGLLCAFGAGYSIGGALLRMM